MRALCLAAVLLLLPSAAHAARLLEGPGLTLSGAQGQVTPPPPPPPIEGPVAPRAHPPTEVPADATPGPDVPGRGTVLGYMITGGAVMVAGLLYAYVGVLLLLVDSSCGRACSTFVPGLVFMVLALAHEGLGAMLLINGNNKRLERNAAIEAAEQARAGGAPMVAVPLYAWSF